VTKTCKQCLLVKPLTDFKALPKLNLHISFCRPCARVRYNKKKVDRKYYLNNKDKWVARSQRPEVKLKKKQAGKLYREKNKDILYKKQAEQQRINPLRRIPWLLRNRLRMAMKKKVKKGSAVRDLGCSIEEFKKYLESLFQPGMSWDNQGLYGWHIDHIIPLSSFDLQCPEQVKIACNYKNLQPLWAQDNLSKGYNI
jgi:hypothetical protein